LRTGSKRENGSQSQSQEKYKDAFSYLHITSLSNRTVINQSPVLKSNDPMAEVDYSRIMAYDHYQSLLVFCEFQKHLGDLAACTSVERSRRLVGQYDRRIIYQSASDCHALLFAAAQLIRLQPASVA